VIRPAETPLDADQEMLRINEMIQSFIAGSSGAA
jgi:hypothetical protein